MKILVQLALYNVLICLLLWPLFYVWYMYCYPSFFLHFLWIKCLFHPFTFSLCVSFVLRWVSCRQHIYGSCFLIQSAMQSLLIGTFRTFIFKVIIDRYIFIAILFFITIFLSFFYLFSTKVPLTFLVILSFDGNKVI